LKNNSVIVHSKLPDAGLGNKLFAWAHGVIFANNNNLNHYTSGLTKVKLGPILRREKSWRLYINLFKKQFQYNKIAFLFKNNETLVSYKNCDTKIDTNKKTTYIFNEVPHWSDYFLHIRVNREVVIEAFKKELKTELITKWAQKKDLEIGVHIRLGDFKKLAQNESFAKVGATRTPLNYFIEVITQIRSVTNKQLKVTVFTDGKLEELKPLFDLPNIEIAEDDTDLMQMLHLSKSKILILSAGSTFGQWAAYLSNAIIINHYQHFHSYIRDGKTNEQMYEGVIDPSVGITDNHLINQLKNI
jgi:hypothetical protein